MGVIVEGVVGVVGVGGLFVGVVGWDVGGFDGVFCGIVGMVVLVLGLGVVGVLGFEKFF